MEKIDKNVRKVTRKIKKLYGESPDLNTRIIDIQGQKLVVFFSKAHLKQVPYLTLSSKPLTIPKTISLMTSSNH